MIEVKRYTDADAELWNKFNAESKNPLFMFDRNYMDYHRDRFQDHSLMFYEDEKLVAILPMSERENELVSHGGLTYGGFITDNKMKQHTMNECVTSLLQYAETEGFDRVYYKVIPHIFHEQPAEEDRYALFVQNARIEKIEASTVINLKKPLKMPKGRKAQISRARREGVIIEERSSATDFDEFIALENSVLSEHHGTKAVHTGAELKLLHDRFPENIHLYAAIYKNKIIAGTVIFEYAQVVHTQYMAADEVARQIGALDLTISTVIDTFKEKKLWLDFGISTEDGGKYLNEGLISQKEGFGGRTNVYEMWKLEI